MSKHSKQEVDKFFSDVADSIENGEYFKQAKKWYMGKYVFPLVERSFLVLTTIVMLVTAFFMLSMLNSFFPLTKRVPVVIENVDPAELYIDLRKLSRPGETKDEVNKVVMRYLVKIFVETYEEYDPRNNFDTITRNTSYIKRYADPKVLQEYEWRMSNKNINGFKRNYKTNTLRNIVVENVVILNKKEEGSGYLRPYFPDKVIPSEEQASIRRAIVDIIAYERTSREAKPYRYKVLVTFNFSDISFDKRKGDFLSMDFKVLDYTSKKI